MRTEKINILDEIVEHKRREVEIQKEKVPFETFVPDIGQSTRDFKSAITRQGKDNRLMLIAELKFASPSSGKIRDAGKEEMSRILGFYDEYASAISVLTDEKYFGGKLEYIKDVSSSTKIPILRKDFIVDEYQIMESRYHGADAVLLIVSVLGEEKLGQFIKMAKSFGMDALVEVHDEEDLDIALRVGADIVGINNRNLKTMNVDVGNTIKLSSKIPDDVVVVSESGIKTKEDILSLKLLNVDAVLVGTAIMTGDVLVKLKEFTGALDD